MSWDMSTCDGVLSSIANWMIPWSSQPVKVAAHLGRGMWCGVSSRPWLPKAVKSGPWDQHRTCVIWEPVRNAGSQASPRWTRICIFWRSLAASGPSSVWDALSWRKLSVLLWAHCRLPLQPPTFLLAGLCSRNTPTCGVASTLLICILIRAAEIC